MEKYPENPDEHIDYGRNKKNRIPLVLDENYPYLDKSLYFKFRSVLQQFIIYTACRTLSYIRFGMRIEGRDKLRKNRDLFKNGAMTVANHVLRWDYIMVLLAIRYRWLYVPVWKENLEGSDRNMIRWAGGIPVPSQLHLIRYFNQAFDELHKRRAWIHAFPESANWHYYPYIRPFKKGVFSMAVKYQLPIIPMAFCWRPAKGLQTLLNQIRKTDNPSVTLRIGEPIVMDFSMKRREAVQWLRAETHKRIIELAGVRDNPWPAEGD
jgi:1-acyl-sn-glycerol-3-phosphate acyltransferase